MINQAAQDILDYALVIAFLEAFLSIFAVLSITILPLKYPQFLQSTCLSPGIPQFEHNTKDVAESA